MNGNCPGTSDIGKCYFVIFVSHASKALLGTGGIKFWTGLTVDPEHGWKWTNGKPYRYMKWDSGRFIPYSLHICISILILFTFITFNIIYYIIILILFIYV